MRACIVEIGRVTIVEGRRDRVLRRATTLERLARVLASGKEGQQSAASAAAGKGLVETKMERLDALIGGAGCEERLSGRRTRCG